MKYVDEFRDGELIARARDEIRRLVDPGAALSDHGGVRRPHARDLPIRLEGPASAQHRAHSRSRVPGLRPADGPHRRRALDGGTPGRHLRGVRRHDAGAGNEGQPARLPGARHGRAHRLLAARRAQAGAAQSRPACDVLRDRIRDDGAVDRADADAGEGRGHQEFFGLLQPRHDHSRDPRDPRFAGHAPRRFRRARPRLDCHRLPALRVDCARSGQADRGVRASSRSTSCRAS